MIWKIVLLLGFLAGPALADRSLEGRVTVVRDVDTIIVAGTPVRLNGLDGPETSTRIGREARTFMERLVRGEMVTCAPNGERTYDRWVGICFLATIRISPRSQSRTGTRWTVDATPVGGIAIWKPPRPGPGSGGPGTARMRLV